MFSCENTTHEKNPNRNKTNTFFIVCCERLYAIATDDAAQAYYYDGSFNQIFPTEAAEGTEELFVTPRDIDSRVRDAARLVGYAVNLALHDGLTVRDVDMFLS